MNPKRDILKDSRSLSAFIPAPLDDLNLTVEAFRVYGHLVRRAGKDNNAYPSYLNIGKVCFRGSYPESPDSTLKAKAIAAVEELIAFGLIWKDRSEDGGSNIYHLMDSHHWKRPEVVENINVRKGRQGKSRKKRKEVNQANPSVNGDNLTRLTGITDPVNGDNLTRLTGITDPVNGDNLTRLTGITDPVNGDNPKDIHLRESIEGTPSKDPEGAREKSVSPSDRASNSNSEPEPVSVELPPRNDAPTEPPVQPFNTQGGDRAAAIIHPTKKMDDRFNRGGRLEVWEIAINEPDPSFLDWLAANDKCGNSSLPPRTKAKRTLYNSRDRCDSLAADLWHEFQASGGRIEPQTYADKRAMQTYQAAMAAIADL